MKISLTIICAFLVIISSIFFWQQLRIDEFGDRLEDATSSKTSDGGSADNFSTKTSQIENELAEPIDVTKRSGELFSLLEISSDLLESDNAASWYELVLRAKNSGYEDLANWATIELQANCLPTLKGVKFSTQNDWADDRLNEKCSSYSKPMYQEATALNSIINSSADPQSIAFQELSEQIQLADENERESIVTGALTQAETPYEVKAALRAYFDEINSPIISSLGIEDQNMVRFGVFNMYECEVFGGCGPDSFLLLSLCTQSSLCLEGWSMNEYLSNTMSPIQYEYATQITNFLLNGGH